MDRLLGERGIEADTPAGRRESERRMEARRAQEIKREKLACPEWTAAEPRQRTKIDPDKLRIAARLRRETTPCPPVGR